MNWDEVIGLLISLGAFLYLMFRTAFKAHRAPEEELEELPPPLPKRKTKPIPKKEPVVAKIPFSEAPSYDVIGRAKVSRSNRILSSLRSKKDMVIFKEIIGPPKGL